MDATNEYWWKPKITKIKKSIADITIKEELELIQAKMRDRSRYLNPEVKKRYEYLCKKIRHNHCINPHCDIDIGGNDEDNYCPKCGSLLFKFPDQES